MQKIATPIKDLYVIQLKIFHDERGFFVERLNSKALKEIDLDLNFVQSNHSFSNKNVLRGLHAQPEQGKLVSIIRGEILDVAVDIRPASPTFGQHFSINLSAENGKMLWIPDGFLHGFQVLSEDADMIYNVTDYYNPHTQFSVSPFDQELNITWPNKEGAIINERDLNSPLLQEIMTKISA